MHVGVNAFSDSLADLTWLKLNRINFKKASKIVSICMITCPFHDLFLKRTIFCNRTMGSDFAVNTVCTIHSNIQYPNARY